MCAHMCKCMHACKHTCMDMCITYCHAVHLDFEMCMRKDKKVQEERRLRSGGQRDIIEACFTESGRLGC